MGRKRKSVCGCIVGTECSVLSLVIVQKGEKEIAGITDSERKRSLAPKRAALIRKAWQLDKDLDVRAFNYEKKYTSTGGKERSKRPKIQRLVTSTKLKRWRKLKNIKVARYKKAAQKAAAYKAMLDAKKGTAS